ncbi:hypothetical protein [Hyalangium minutum]|uniref:Lipoprotein n=1 Tax=Hyalangium minutum TaxID=394096 RepID=A0A085WP50_9BACT|nr:hypothetical protein [Hyalangium minutum]KFE69463.1 hypothetical protein DB31_6438 [Hyalangium minutum]
MKRLLLLPFSLVATLGFGCSNSSSGDAPQPTQQVQVKKRTQALSTDRVTLEEVAVSEAVLTAAGSEASVRAFRIVSSAEDITMGELASAAHVVGASEVANLPWQVEAERGQDDTRRALKYLDALVPAIEAEVGTGEDYNSGYQHWFQTVGEDLCNHGDFYSLVFKQTGLVFVIEASGATEC